MSKFTEIIIGAKKTDKMTEIIYQAKKQDEIIKVKHRDDKRNTVTVAIQGQNPDLILTDELTRYCPVDHIRLSLIQLRTAARR
jgi:VCBS repeat-containing protein